MADKPNVVWHEQSISSQDRFSLNGHRGCVVWFTGLSGSGKSTIANQLDQLLFHRRVRTFVLDGDNLRHGLCAGPNLLSQEYGPEFADRFGLGFQSQDREENIRRVGAVAQLMASAGLVCLTALVSPYRADRNRVRHWVDSAGSPISYIEVYVNTSIEECIERDPKGLYKQALAGKIKNFTGISDTYEPPDSPEIELVTKSMTPGQAAKQVLDYLVSRGIVPE